MKILAFLLMVCLLPLGFNVWGAGPGGEVARSAPPAAARSAASRPASASRSAASRPARATTSNRSRQAFHAPATINISHSASGRYNRNFPSRSRASNTASTYQNASYAQLNWNNTTRTAPQASAPTGETTQSYLATLSPSYTARSNVQNNTHAVSTKAAVAVHHHPYVAGYVRVKLKKLGVTAEPGLITDRSQIIDTDKNHSTISYPQRGLNNQLITATAVASSQFDGPVIRNQMMILDSPEWQGRADQFNSSETQEGHYYWHNTVGVNYCHYLDSSGYNWYGWYLGSQFFWVRNFDGRWWWYDSNFSRWCFWNNGYWWWQDPDHIGDLYCYDNNTYIPCNSADDQVVVTAANNDPMQSTTSPDGTRIVELDQVTEDAFLYDAANPPTFSPVYLASGVESVQFSNPANGRPMEILLKLDDGSFDLFDAQGNTYNPGLLDENEAKQGDPPPDPVAQGTTP